MAMRLHCNLINMLVSHSTGLRYFFFHCSYTFYCLIHVPKQSYLFQHPFLYRSIYSISSHIVYIYINIINIATCSKFRQAISQYSHFGCWLEVNINGSGIGIPKIYLLPLLKLTVLCCPTELWKPENEPLQQPGWGGHVSDS